MLIFAILNVFIQDNPRRIISYQKRQLPCRARETRANSYFRTYRSTRMVLYIKHVLFLLIDRSVCIIQNNQTSDVLIKYIANYHILYSGQLEIRSSVAINCDSPV